MIEGFLRYGILGAVRLGMPISDAVLFLGEPEDRGKGPKGWRIEPYAEKCLQVAHHNGIVGLIGIYFDRGNEGYLALPPAVRSEMPFSFKTTPAEFRNYLEGRGIPYEDDSRLRDTVAFKVESDVVATFVEGQLCSLLISAK